MENKDLTILVPYYNENPKNLQIIRKVCEKRGIRLLIIDDGSNKPVKGAIRRWKNKGCGSAIKFGLGLVKTKYAGIIDADGQYDINDLFKMWDYLELTERRSRFRKQELKCYYKVSKRFKINDICHIIGRRKIHRGSWKRFFGRLFLKIYASILAGRYIPDLNTGVRIFKTNIGKSYRSLMCDQFSYCSSITLAMLLDGYRTEWYPIEFYPRKGEKSTVKEIKHGLQTVFQLTWITMGLRTRKIRQWLRGK